MIDQNRVKLEIDALTDCFEEVRFDLDEGWIELESFPLPDHWNRETTTVRIEVPESYPVILPAVYVPDNLRFDGDRPSRMLRTGPAGWYRYNLHGFSLDGAHFNTESDSIVSTIRILARSLKNPDDPLNLHDTV